eukprot:scaffold992_cov175-Amphora_coffeaeformis.AAC.13
MASRKRPRVPEASASSIDYTLRSSFEVVPWKDVWEFQSVGEALLSAASSYGEPEAAGDNNFGLSIPRALAIVEHWKHRVALLPHGVEATASLASVRWRDANNQESFLFSQTELRLAYAGAIIRAVNGLVDTLQQSRTVAMSISQLSVQLGLPTWLVDIRHEATHNQLPTLPVLRMGATTLLDYFGAAYWRPTQEATMQTEQSIYQALHDYEYKADQEAFKRDKGSSAASVECKKNHGTEESVEYMAIPSEDEEEGKKEEEEETVAPVIESRIGTNINMFALLMDPPKKKKGKKDASKGKTSKKAMKPTKKAKPKKKATSLTALPSLAPVARTVTQGNPLPILWHCFVTHMVWGRADSSSNNGGALLKVCDQRAQRKYHTLLSMVGRDLPGLMQTLLVHLVDYVLRYGGESPRNATIAVSWIKYLLSRRFVLASRQSGKWTLSNPADETADRTLLHFDLPVKSLWERCRICHATAISQRAVVQTLMKVLAQIMGEEDLPSLPPEHPSIAGVEIGETKDNEEPPMAVESTPTIEEANTLDAEKTKSTMSLEDMESMLSCSVKPPASENPDSKNLQALRDPVPPVNGWTRCTSWESCPIGSLPGYPT